jgi:hypothetical protein
MSGRKTIKEFYDWIYHDKGLYFKRKFEAFLDQNLDTGYRNIAKCEIKDKTCCCRKKKAFIDEYEMSLFPVQKQMSLRLIKAVFAFYLMGRIFEIEMSRP